MTTPNLIRLTLDDPELMKDLDVQRWLAVAEKELNAHHQALVDRTLQLLTIHGTRCIDSTGKPLASRTLKIHLEA